MGRGCALYLYSTQHSVIFILLLTSRCCCNTNSCCLQGVNLTCMCTCKSSWDDTLPFPCADLHFTDSGYARCPACCASCSWGESCPSGSFILKYFTLYEAFVPGRLERELCALATCWWVICVCYCISWSQISFCDSCVWPEGTSWSNFPVRWTLMLYLVTPGPAGWRAGSGREADFDPYQLGCRLGSTSEPCYPVLHHELLRCLLLAVAFLIRCIPSGNVSERAHG